MGNCKWCGRWTYRGKESQVCSDCSRSNSIDAAFAAALDKLRELVKGGAPEDTQELRDTLDNLHDWIEGLKTKKDEEAAADLAKAQEERDAADEAKEELAYELSEVKGRLAGLERERDELKLKVERAVAVLAGAAS